MSGEPEQTSNSTTLRRFKCSECGVFIEGHVAWDKHYTLTGHFTREVIVNAEPIAEMSHVTDKYRCSECGEDAVGWKNVLAHNKATGHRGHDIYISDLPSVPTALSEFTCKCGFKADWASMAEHIVANNDKPAEHGAPGADPIPSSQNPDAPFGFVAGSAVGREYPPCPPPNAPTLESISRKLDEVIALQKEHNDKLNLLLDVKSCK